MDKSVQFPPVAVVILNWNGQPYLERFLPILKKSTYPNYRIYVADNGSSDDTVSFLGQYHPDVVVLAEMTNEGFAGGYNRAITHVQEEYLVLLNSDIEVTPDWLQPAIAMLVADPTIGAVQPKLLDYHARERFEYAGAAGGWIDRLGYPFSKGRIFDALEKDEHQYDASTHLFWASGAAMFTRKSIFQSMGGFDAFFFAHQEEIDLCWRMQLAGYIIMSCPASVVYHIGGGTLPKDNPRKVFLNFRNNLIMLWKNLGGAERIMVITARFALDAISAWKNVVNGQPSYFVAVMKAHVGFISWLFKKKKLNPIPIDKCKPVQGRYMGSIVWQHFIKKKTRFSEIVSTVN